MADRGSRPTALLNKVAEIDASQEAPLEPKVLPTGMVSLVKVLARRLQTVWRRSGNNEEQRWSDAIYNTEIHIKRRPPNEIEAVLATMDHSALRIIEQNFGSRMPELQEFAEAVVRTGTYDADAVLGFIGGVVDLFLEVLWSQADKAYGAEDGTVRWGQLMNHFIESPEIAMFEGSQAATGGKAGGSQERTAQMQPGDVVDCAKHPGAYIDKMYWIQHLDSLVTCEGTESVYFWNPMENVDAPRCIQTPQLKDVPDCFDENDKPLYTVLGIASDGQDIVALCSNRLLIVWRLRSREKFQFRQRAIYRLHAEKSAEVGQKGRDPWKVNIKPVDTKNESLSLNPSSTPVGTKRPSDGGRGGSSARKEAQTGPDVLEREEKSMRLQMKDDRNAKEVANQLDIWYNTQRRLWITSDKNGKLFFWDLASIENTPEPGPFEPLHAHAAHKRIVTAYIEVGHRKFVSASLDRAVVLWDTPNLTPEMRIEDHTACVLDLAYLNSFYSLISVGCEKRVYVWSIDSTAYRGLTAKLSGHQANLVKVSSGNDQRGRAFFTLDEACVVIIWDVATLSSLQTFNCSKQNPRHALCFSNLGRFCLAGRRFYFYEGNELMALNYMGATPSKEQLAKAKKPVAGSFKERAKPRWCGINEMRGTVVSVTEAEVRVHARSDPSQSRVIFCLNEGEVITSYATMDSMHLCILGTSKGGLHFVKCRSGFTIKSYQGRLEGDAWEPGAGGPPPGGAGGSSAPVEFAQAEAEANKARGPAGSTNPRASGSSPSLVSCSADGSPKGARMRSTSVSMTPQNAGRGGQPVHLAMDTIASGAQDQSSADGSENNQAEEEEWTQELQEIKEVASMGYSEQDARRALQQRRKLADALREWYQDEAAQQAYEKTDAETQTKTLEEVKAGNGNANIENAVEKLLSGAIVTTGAEDQLLLRAPIRQPRPTAKGSKEGVAFQGEEDKSRPRRLSASHNAPSPEEIAKGLTRKIQCVLPCEEQKRIYVGTDEGQVLVHSCDPNFTIKRWLTQPGPNVAAVTCLDAVYEDREDGPWGLLLVGTAEGSAHLYGLPNLRLAGSINVGRVIPDVNPESGDLQLRHAKLIWMPTSSSMSTQFPLAVMTIDRKSRFRFWGVRLHAQSGKLEELALMFDGGQLTEIKEEVMNPYADPLEEDAAAKHEKEVRAKKDAEKGSKDLKVPLADQFLPTARITTLCSIKGQIVLPIKAVPGALLPGEKAAAAETPAAPAVSAAFAALALAFAESGGSGNEAETDPRKDSKAGASFPGKEESSDTEEDDRPETLEWRKILKKRRPKTADNGLHAETHLPHPPQVASADGSNYIFLGDAVGRIWCIDVVGSTVEAHQERQPLTVLLDENNASLMASKGGRRPSVRFNSGSTVMSNNGSPTMRKGTSDGFGSAVGSSKTGVPTPTPEALKIAHSWQAHDHALVSLVSTTSPPALVSTDTEKMVKVWSTSGELWGHFQMAGVDPGNTFLWPPPHVLAAQHALMTIAKGLCKKLGLRTSGVHTESTAAKGHAVSRHTRKIVRKKTQEKKKPEKKVVVVGDDKATDDEDNMRFMTEPRMSTRSEPASRSTAQKGAVINVLPPKPSSAPHETKALSAKVEGAATGDPEIPPEEVSVGILFDDGDVSPGGDDGGMLGDGTAPKAHTRSFSREQMTKMIRNRGFSSGFQNYKQFLSKSQSGQASGETGRRKGDPLSGLDAQRSCFFGRDASDFGVSFITRKETDHWHQSTKSMGVRSSSEGALYRFAQAAVLDQTRSVYDDLGVDVSKTDMYQLRKPSFLAHLDRRPEVEHGFLDDPASSTAQAVATMRSEMPKGRRINSKKSALASTGKAVVKK